MTTNGAEHVAYLGLGSNLGNRDAALRRALDLLAAVVRVDAVSDVYDTAPLLVEDQPRFRNLVARVTTVLPPLALLRACQGVEAALGRTRLIRYGPRTVDIDILLYDALVLHDDGLDIPHPAMAERAFVLLPLAELAPDLVHPVLGRTIGSLAASLGQADARRVGALPPAVP